MSVSELRLHGFVHLHPGRSDGKFFLRLSKPLLRLLKVPGRLKDLFDPYTFDSWFLPILERIFKTCRDYHGDTQEAVQLVSHMVACAAYVLLTPSSRPHVKSLADLRPGATVVGDHKALETAFQVLAQEAAAVDEATAERRKAYEDAVEAEASANGAAEAEKLKKARTAASSAYVDARHEAFRKFSGRILRERGDCNEGKPRDAALTAAGTIGVDAWVFFGKHVYTMQCKGQETGEGAGMPGSDVDTFQPSQTRTAVAQFKGWAFAKRALALELLTTKRMTDASKLEAAAAVDGGPPAVVVVARDALLNALGLIFGVIAGRFVARCDS